MEHKRNDTERRYNVLVQTNESVNYSVNRALENAAPGQEQISIGFGNADLDRAEVPHRSFTMF